MRGSVKKRVGKRGTTYTAVVDIGLDREGNRKQKRKTFKGSKEAWEWVNETLVSVRKGTYIEPSKYTVGEWLKEWLKTEGKQNLSPTSFEWYSTTIYKHLIPALGNIPLNDLKPNDIKKYHNKALEGGRIDKKESLGRNLSPTTVKNHHAVLRKALQDAYGREIIPRNPADVAKPPRKAKHEVKFLPVDDAVKIIKLFKGTYLYMPVFLAVVTGARRSEILALKWSDIENSIAYIGRAIYTTKEGLAFKETKNNTSRRAVTLSPQAMKELKKLKKEQAKIRIAAGEAWQGQDLICCLQDGRPINPSTVTKRFQEVTEGAGYKVTFHQLRHAHASYLLKQGVHPKVVAERLGHSTISTTLDIYSHVAPSLQQEVAKNLDALLFKK